MKRFIQHQELARDRRFIRQENLPGSFPFTLYDKSAGGPYHHVRVRFEPGGNPAAKAISVSFLP